MNSETISSAQAAYPNVKFVAADVTCAGELFPTQFDIIYAFNAFPDQDAALCALRLAAKNLKPPSAFLIILTEADSRKHVSRKNLRRCSGVRYR